HGIVLPNSCCTSNLAQLEFKEMVFLADGLLSHLRSQLVKTELIEVPYVVRLWEDILDILPAILEPLPTELSSLFERDKTAWFDWEGAASTWVDHQPNEDEMFEYITSWQRARRLDAAYLKNAPRIWIWSTEQNVIISWDNADIALEGSQIWSAVQGHYCIERDEFLDEVYSFHNRLMREMAERVEAVCDRWHRSTIYVDTQALRREQQERETWLEQALKRSASIVWDDVLAANSVMLDYFSKTMRG
ncbi:MAG: DUF5984 family protein, partial [Oculatellaceae cyanobacterium bins.114]|nr:DUF5984 family protein [Oculatellaceae cyanobacterium bins.114]